VSFIRANGRVTETNFRRDYDTSFVQNVSRPSCSCTRRRGAVENPSVKYDRVINAAGPVPDVSRRLFTTKRNGGALVF